jgi:microcystin degradation protein MlrC
LAPRNADHRVDEVKVRKLPIDAVVNDMHGLEAVFEGVVDGNGSLQRSRLDGERSDPRGVV